MQKDYSLQILGFLPLSCLSTSWIRVHYHLSILGMMSDFRLYPGHLGYCIIRPCISFKSILADFCYKWINSGRGPNAFLLMKVEGQAPLGLDNGRCMESIRGTPTTRRGWKPKLLTQPPLTLWGLPWHYGASPDNMEQRRGTALPLGGGGKCRSVLGLLDITAVGTWEGCLFTARRGWRSRLPTRPLLIGVWGGL